jgi:hypothetical protein
MKIVILVLLSMFLKSYLWKLQGQLGTHARLGSLLYSVTVLYNVDTFPFPKLLCDLQVSSS